ncbi:MAG TPA: hypothetical protein ENH10_03120 [Bacteroidetes bacterium]|nr:hypothetical protein BMS3Bbin04_00694 [bacterium BMS3Bbin04]HDO65008.1 hypothetical protein [Bacteroidota bacterium]HEX04133.1 hypothetical protein [Bacteroidota bacterium]
MQRLPSFILLVLLLLMVGVNVQAKDTSPQVLEKMSQLRWMEGTWVGETMMSRTGRTLPEAIQLTETAHFELDGMILILEGVAEKGGQIVTHTYTSITYSVKRQRFVMFAMTQDGGIMDPTFNANDKGVQWRMKSRKGFVKYTVENMNGQWLETGYSSADGETWDQIFSVTLKK